MFKVPPILVTAGVHLYLLALHRVELNHQQQVVT